MSPIERRVASLEAHAGMADGHMPVNEIHIIGVEPGPDGPRYTGDVLIRRIGRPGEGEKIFRDDLAGAGAPMRSSQPDYQ